ncbi:MAG: DNA polymerase/3'-5' exonuclease PolX [Gemmatimonadota bacterium]
MENLDIGRIFEEVADLLEIQSANPFRVRAYRTAARTVEAQSVPVALLVDEEGALEELPGIGKDLAEKIREIVRTGELALLRELRAQTPPGLAEMMHISGLGPKRAKQIYDELQIATLDDLEAAAREGRLQELHGFGPTLEAKVIQGLAEHRARAGRFRLADADAYVRPLLAYLEKVEGIETLEVAGSYRRRCETVGDVDILIAAKDGGPIAEQFVAYPQVAEVLAQGATKSSVRLKAGLQADLRIVPPESWGAALHYFTGSTAHNIAVRRMGVKRKLKINEYGVFRGDRRVGGRTEAEVYAAVDLPYIPPELREDRGEFEAARDGTLLDLVTPDDIRGDLQMHTTRSDGRNTLEEMVLACRARGYAYAAITDHTQAVRVAGGLDAAAFREQFREIDRLQDRLDDFRILKSAEVDILDDGTLDLDDDTLAALDLVVVSVHSKFNLTKAQMTRRVVRALRHPRTRIFGHPTGRILGRREPYPLDLEEVVKAALEHNVALEVNAQPDRLDLNDIHVRMARDAGAPIVISTDAHRIEELDFMRYGVDQARRGWCEAKHVWNALPLADLLARVGG